MGGDAGNDVGAASDDGKAAAAASGKKALSGDQHEQFQVATNVSCS